MEFASFSTYTSYWHSFNVLKKAEAETYICYITIKYVTPVKQETSLSEEIFFFDIYNKTLWGLYILKKKIFMKKNLYFIIKDTTTVFCKRFFSIFITHLKYVMELFFS